MMARLKNLGKVTKTFIDLLGRILRWQAVTLKSSLDKFGLVQRKDCDLTENFLYSGNPNA